MKDIIKRTGLLPYVLVIAILIAGLAGLTMLDNARAAGGGDGPGNVTAKAYTAGVTKGTFVKLTTAGVIDTAAAATDNIVGVCRTTADANQLTSYAPVGSQTAVTSGEAIAVGDQLTAGAGGKAFVIDDSGALTQRVPAIATTVAAAADTSVNCVVVSSTVIGFADAMTAITGNVALDANSSGRVHNVTADAVITLPATDVGVTYTFVCDGLDTTVQISLSPNASDVIRGMGSIGVDDKDWINTKGTAAKGDCVTIVADGAEGWFIVRQSGTWAAEG